MLRQKRKKKKHRIPSSALLFLHPNYHPAAITLIWRAFILARWSMKALITLTHDQNAVSLGSRTLKRQHTRLLHIMYGVQSVCVSGGNFWLFALGVGALCFNAGALMLLEGPHRHTPHLNYILTGTFRFMPRFHPTSDPALALIRTRTRWLNASQRTNCHPAF